MSDDTPSRDEQRIEVTAMTLHNRRHPLGTAASCGRCQADAEAVAQVWLRSPS